MAALTIRRFSLAGYIQRAKELDKDEDELAFQQFLLTGRDIKQNVQAYLDVSTNALSIDHPITVARDFDSLLGVTDDIRVNAPISLSVTPNPREALSSGVHLTYSATGTDEDGVEVAESCSLHQIPNFQFATWGLRCQIHIFFPCLAFGEGSQRGGALKPEQCSQFYEIGLRPAIESLLPGNISDWPPTYAAELFRGRKISGHMSYQSKVFPEELVPYLADTIRDNLRRAGLRWTTNFFFLHTIRGVKGSTQHAVNPDYSEFAFYTLLIKNNLSEQSLARGEWWVDVGMEFHSPDELCLQWETVSHSSVVGQALKISEGNATRITSFGSSKYERDIASHLMGVSGCRITPGPQAEGEFEAAYLQMYTTDKAITYLIDGAERGKTMTIKDAMGSEQPSRFIAGLRQVFVDAMTKNSSNARLEVRVPVKYANTALNDLDLTVIRSSLLEFRRAHWWNFKVLYVEAVTRLLMQQQIGSASLRIRGEALLLTAACVWLINALHSRPKDGKAPRALMQRILPVTDASDPDRDTLLFNSWDYRDATGEYLTPFNPYGAIFLRRIVLDVDVPRMSIDRDMPPLPTDCFRYLFTTSEDEIQHRYAPIGIIPRGVQATRRIVTNKTKRTPRFIDDAHLDEPVGVLFNLASQGFSLPPPPIDDGSDIEANDGNPAERPGAETIDEKVTQLYRQFLVDMINKSPSPRRSSSPSYSTLTANQKLRATEDLYANLNFSEIWRQCTWKIAQLRDMELAFSHLFPIPDHEASAKIQNYTQCQYYRTWKVICATSDELTADAIRMAIRKRLFRLKWIPYACCDKMWSTSQKVDKDKGWVRFPPGSSGPAPHILCRIKPHWGDRVDAEVIEL